MSTALRWLAAWWSRLIAGSAFAVVAVVTGRISYVHIQELTLALHQPASIAQIMPFGVDGLIVVGSVALLQAGETQPWLGWVCVIPGALVSLFANVWSFIGYGLLSAAWAGVASMSFIVATYTLERWLKAQFKASTRPGSGTPAAASETTVPDGAAQASPELAQPASPLAALQTLLDSESERNLAFLLGVDRNRVKAWQRRLDASGEEPDEDDAAEAAGASQGHVPATVNGSAHGG